MQHALINDKFVLKQANNLFAYALPVEPQTTPEKKQCQIKFGSSALTDSA